MRDYPLLIVEAAVLMEMAPTADPRPGRVPEQDLLNPQNLSAMAAELCIVFGKILRVSGFLHHTQSVAVVH